MSFVKKNNYEIARFADQSGTLMLFDCFLNQYRFTGTVLPASYFYLDTVQIKQYNLTVTDETQ